MDRPMDRPIPPAFGTVRSGEDLDLPRIRSRAELDTTRPPDYVLLGTTLVLLAFGLIAVYSSSFGLAIRLTGDPAYFFVRQVMAAIGGLMLMAVVMRIDYHRYLRWSPWFMLGAIGILVAVLIPGLGVELNGAQRWIRLGPLPPFQPSEFIKLAMFIYIAAWLSTRGSRLQQWNRVLPFIGLLGAIGVLMLLQNDFGTAVIMLGVALAMFFVAGANLRHVAALVGVAVVVAPVLIWQASHRWNRILAFLDPIGTGDGAGYQILQSLIALGSGGLFGVGLGASRQKFLYVPAAHTDAIFAIIGEELGLIGCTVVLMLLGLIAYRGYRIALEAREDFGALLAFGITTWFALQAAINIGGITATIPLTGVTLPFVSYGGSSLVASLAALGVLLSISRFRVTEAERKHGLPSASAGTTLHMR